MVSCFLPFFPNQAGSGPRLIFTYRLFPPCASQGVGGTHLDLYPFVFLLYSLIFHENKRSLEGYCFSWSEDRKENPRESKSKAVSPGISKSEAHDSDISGEKR